MQQAVKIRSTAKAKITRINSFLDSAKVAAVPSTTLEARLEMLRESWKELEVAQANVETLTQEGDMPAQDKEREEQEEKYAAIMSGIKALIVQQQSPSGQIVSIPHVSSHSSDRFVPKFEMPSFTGKFSDWPNFKNVFTTMVHEKDLRNHQKLHILKMALQGDAAHLLSSTLVTDDNYEESWKSVIKRYDNERQLLLAQTHIILHSPFMKSESAKEMRNLLDSIQGALRSIKSMKIPIDNWDPLLVSIIIERLDSDTRRNWELQLQTTTMPTFLEIEAYLELRCQALETFESNNKVSNSNSTAKPHRTASHHTTTASASQCLICKEEHPAYKCKAFHEMPVPMRMERVKKAVACFNCLRIGHGSHQCKSTSTCRSCGGKHHTLLHAPKTQPPRATPALPSINNNHATGETTLGNVLLASAVVRVQDRTGQYQLARALLDSGSEASFVSESLVQRLGLKKTKSRINVTGLSQASTGTTSGITNVLLSSRHNPRFTATVNTLVLPKVTGRLPSTTVTLKDATFTQNLLLADPQFNTPGEMDILLGADCFGEFIIGNIKHGGEGIHAIETVFGWVLTGKISHPPIHVYHATVSVEEQLRKFWEVEELPLSQPLLTEEEAKCQQHFDSCHTRDDTGRYILQLPFRDEAPELGSSRETAEKCFYSLEKRLARSPELKQQYVKFMREYISLGHMERIETPLIPQLSSVPTQQPGVQHFYMPHHEVIKESSTTTKLRVVFNVSKKSTSGTSLNDRLMIGPKVQRDLWDLLIGFRTHAIALTADIEKMYRQILIHPCHQPYQLILWRESCDQPLHDYVLKTVTYGESSAPFQAQATLKQLSVDEQSDFPSAAKVVSSDFYMDDLMSGVSSESEAVHLVQNLIQLLGRGGFQLRKWSSNSSTVLQSIPESMRETQLPFSIDSDESVKTLGLHWNPSGDYFCYKVSLPPITSKITKRTMLSDTAKIFDPIGLLAPCIIIPKMFLQKLWITGLNWDEEIPEELCSSWLNFRSQLVSLQEIKIPRQIADFKSSKSYQIHGFCDASIHAYAAAIYLRCVTADLKIKVHLVAAKSRVAPVKQISLPRLELCGAALLANLVKKILDPLNLTFDGIYCWTDSTVVLSWIKELPIKWKTFVANRVTEIQSVTSITQWNHVPGQDNPADAPSRGINPADLSSHSLWWTGPTWLQQGPVPAPSVNFNSAHKTADSELRKIVSLHSTVAKENELLTRFSSLVRLQRITALLLRFSWNLRCKKEDRRHGLLSVSELDSALQVWIKTIQKANFYDEIQCCIQKIPLHSKSRLSSLHPFLDENGILRVGGRIQAASVPWDQKFPIVLPKNGQLTKLIVHQTHLLNLHAGPRLLLSTLQQKYWVLSGRNVVRQIVHKCLICYRYRSSTAQQLMGNLPSARLSPQCAFYYTGLDYAGPISLRVSKGRGQKTYKGYIAVFVCMTTKAMHLECVSDQTSAAFLAALRRFIGRRSNTRIIYSDNGTNFVGANEELQELRKLAEDEAHHHKVASFLTGHGIDWNFIPPSAPHMGGLWEAGVKSVKTHLKKVLGSSIWTFEEMSTCLVQIESCLNSRPITSLSSEPSDLNALTPGHFLVLGPMNAIPEPSLMDIKVNRLDRWQLIQRSVQEFWLRWQREYLSSLQPRNKWKDATENLKIGDLVLIKDDRLPPCKWNLGRVLQLHPGPDELVRVVTLKTATGEYKRPVTKLCVLPLDGESSDSSS